MDILERARLGLNAYVKNSAEASAIASVITRKDCSTEDLFIKTPEEALPGILPVLRSIGVDVSSETYKTVLSLLFKMCDSRVLFLVCGPSCAGKDALVSAVNSKLYNRRSEVKYLRKYTTRPQRGFESDKANRPNADPSSQYKYYDSLDSLMSAHPDAVLTYDLYGHDYGFSGEHLRSNSLRDQNLLCIYGRLEDIHQVKTQVLRKFRRIPIAILINSPTDQMERRLDNRTALSPKEKENRIREIKRQNMFIAEVSRFLAIVI